MSLSRTFRPIFLTRRFIQPSLAPAQIRFKSDYGSGDGDPIGERPQEQGKNPSEDKEHPGPPPPDVSKHSSKGQQQQQQQQQPSSGAESSSGKGTQGAQPKILSESPPKEGEEPHDVKKHNEDMAQNAERAHERVSSREQVEDDKVGKGFWKAPDSEHHGQETPVKR